MAFASDADSGLSLVTILGGPRSRLDSHSGPINCGILKPKYCSLGLRAGHYWPWISVYFEGIAANKQGIDAGQWPPLNSSGGGGGGGGGGGLLKSDI
jgi:hypothetical protein